jgi:hypothetical protein
VEFPAAVTLLISVYGAGLATYIAARGLKRDKKALVVTCGLGYRRDADDGHAVQVITIEATNVGARPIEVHGAGFVCGDDGEHIERTPYAVEPSVPPILLADGASARFSYQMTHDTPASELTFEVSKVYVRTSPNGVWFGEPDEWLLPLRMTRRWWG